MASLVYCRMEYKLERSTRHILCSDPATNLVKHGCSAADLGVFSTLVCGIYVAKQICNGVILQSKRRRFVLSTEKFNCNEITNNSAVPCLSPDIACVAAGPRLTIGLHRRCRVCCDAGFSNKALDQKINQWLVSREQNFTFIETGSTKTRNPESGIRNQETETETESRKRKQKRKQKRKRNTESVKEGSM